MSFWRKIRGPRSSSLSGRLQSVSTHIPILDRRRYYTINWQEPGFSRPAPPQLGYASQLQSPRPNNGAVHAADTQSALAIPDAKQMEKRLSLRYGNNATFSRVRSSDWRAAIHDSRKLNLHRDGDPWHFSSSGLFYFHRPHLGQWIRSVHQGGAKRRLKRLVTFR
jgi:hypothetical protein